MVRKRKSTAIRSLTLEEMNSFFYLSVMLGVFPLFFGTQYEKIGTLKYTLFWYSSLIFIGLAMLIVTIKGLKMVTEGKGSPNVISIQGKRFYVLRLSFMDKAMLVYGACVVLSFLFSDFKTFALKGAEGWEMGLYSQLIFLALYWIFSRQRTWIKPALVIHFLSSGLVFLLGILHRFDVDPLGMYPGLTVLQKQQFLSTIGQATWYSSYVCTVFILGVLIFYFSETTKIQLGAGIYTVLSFATLVTQNSDSAFVALGAVVLLLGYFSLAKEERLVRFWQLMTFLWGTFFSVGIIQRIFSERMIPLENLSIFFSQSSFTWVMFCVSLWIYLALDRMDERKLKERLPVIRKVYIGFLAAAGTGLIAVLIFIYLNTKGYLLEWFGYQSAHSYLYFDEGWGNNRGLSWMICWQQFKELPLLHKLFGVGPDSFSAYLYSIPESSERLTSLWGSFKLTNAHNEFLNHLLCYGLVGLGAWLAVLIGGIRYFYEKAKKEPVFIGVALGILAYSCHNFFCYQQVCCTPFLFLLIGIGEGLTKWGKSPSIIKSNKLKK